jgi:hypothetical protein
MRFVLTGRVTFTYTKRKGRLEIIYIASGFFINRKNFFRGDACPTPEVPPCW